MSRQIFFCSVGGYDTHGDQLTAHANLLNELNAALGLARANGLDAGCDAVVGQLASFKHDLGAGDRARIDTYMDNIRELERRIRIAMENSIKEPTADVPFGLPESKHVHFRLMYRFPTKNLSRAFSIFSRLFV